jgi:hydroxyacylglutathione hydrolase
LEPKPIADGLFDLGLEIEGYPPNVVNVYLMGGVIVDAAVSFVGDQILARVAGLEVTAHTLTHVHCDHQGSSHQICETLNIPLFCSETEADYMERGDLLPLVPDNEVNRQLIEMGGGPGHPVARRLKEGDIVGGFVVIETPGHSPGHLSYWRESDRVLVVGDALSNRNYETMEVGLHLPFDIFTVDPALNRQSVRKIAALDPLVLCLGHGPVLHDPDQLHALVESLPDEIAV